MAETGERLEEGHEGVSALVVDEGALLEVLWRNRLGCHRRAEGFSRLGGDLPRFEWVVSVSWNSTIMRRSSKAPLRMHGLVKATLRRFGVRNTCRPAGSPPPPTVRRETPSSSRSAVCFGAPMLSKLSSVKVSAGSICRGLTWWRSAQLVNCGEKNSRRASSSSSVSSASPRSQRL